MNKTKSKVVSLTVMFTTFANDCEMWGWSSARTSGVPTAVAIPGVYVVDSLQSDGADVTALLDEQRKKASWS